MSTSKAPERHREEYAIADENAGEEDGYVHHASFVKELIEEIAALESQLAEMRYSPMGDNHHNARACPYCSPPQAEQGGKP